MLKDFALLEVLYIEILYFLIGLVASAFGAIAGIGGGVIIKPVLDFFGHYDVTTIGVLSAATVFSMASVSLMKAFFSNIKVQSKVAFILALSSIIGGIFGKMLFNYTVSSVSNLELVTIIQSIILTFLMFLIYIYYKNKHSIKTFHIYNSFFIMFVGFILGIIAAYLGIGGGPFNVAILTLGFSMSAKEASVNSIFIIFFSQLTSLLTTQVTTGFEQFNLAMLPYIIGGGILGGIIGSMFLVKINDENVERIFSIGTILILLLSLFNVFKFLIY